MYLAAGELLPFWFGVDVPTEIPPDTYRGEYIYARNNHAAITRRTHAALTPRLHRTNAGRTTLIPTLSRAAGTVTISETATSETAGATAGFFRSRLAETVAVEIAISEEVSPSPRPIPNPNLGLMIAPPPPPVHA